MPTLRSLQARRIFITVLTTTCLCLPIVPWMSLEVHAQDKSGTAGQGAKSKLSGGQASSRSSIKDTEGAAAAQSGPAIVALVNSQKITLQDLANLCVMRHGEEVLENMVNRYLILQACQERKIEITQKDVDDEIARIASKFNLSVQMYLKLLENERDIRPEYYASDIVWPMLALRELSKEMLKVSPQDIDRAFQSEFGPKVQVRMIACKDAAKLQQVHQQATANPELFKTLARDHSEDPASASVEGLLPPIRMHTGEDELERIASATWADFKCFQSWRSACNAAVRSPHGPSQSACCATG